MASSLSAGNDKVADGWEHDDLDLDDTVDDSGAWSFDDDLLVDQSNEEDTDKEDKPSEADTMTLKDGSIHDHEETQQQNNKTLELMDSLSRYVESLPSLCSSLNAVLQAEYNTPEQAMELLEYYQERPQLQSYTLETELPRMDYVVLNGSVCLQEKQEIHEHLSQHLDQYGLLVACCNQSLLSDVLQVLTGMDLMIRPQYMAVAMAKTCRFVLDLQQDTVECTCTLVLSLPDASGEPWNVGQFEISIHLHTTQFGLEYKLDRFEFFGEPKLQETAQFLASLDYQEDFPVEPPQAKVHLHNNDKYRDAFVLKQWNVHSKKLVQNTSIGFQSALQQINTVANVSHKVNSGLALLPLPTAQELQNVEELSTRVVHENSTQNHVSNQQNVQGRPTPILGGFLMSGLSRLAKHVALPEEDPSLYQDLHQTATTTTEPTAIPKLYRTNQEQAQNIPTLYRKTSPEAPKLYRKQDQPKPPEKKQVSPKTTSRRRPPPPPPPRSGNSVSSTGSRRKNRPPPPPPPKSGNSVSSSPSRPKKTRPPPPPPPKKSPVKDGWDDNDDLSLDSSDSPKPCSNKKEKFVHPLTLEVSNLDYDKENDIIETRTRWVNPRFAM